MDRAILTANERAPFNGRMVGQRLPARVRRKNEG
jgi:hypothetical protein